MYPCYFLGKHLTVNGYYYQLDDLQLVIMNTFLLGYPHNKGSTLNLLT